MVVDLEINDVKKKIVVEKNLDLAMKFVALVLVKMNEVGVKNY